MEQHITKKPKSKKSDKTKKAKSTKRTTSMKSTKGTKGTKGTKRTKRTKSTKKGSGYSETRAKWNERNRINHQKMLEKRNESKIRHVNNLQQKNLLRHQARMQRRENTDAKVAAMKIRMSELAKAKRESILKKMTQIRQGQMNMRRPATNHANMRL